MSEDKKGFVERRRSPRVEMAEQISGDVKAIVAYSILNLSATGTLVELPCQLNPGGVYEIRLTFRDRIINVVAQVVRSYVHSLSRKTTAPTMLMYRAGLNFLEMNPEDSEYLGRFVEEQMSTVEDSSRT